MTFSKKIFIAVFFSTLVIGTSLIWTAHNYVRNQTYENFVSRYTVFSRVLGDTLSRLDVHTETLMYNAAKVVVERDSLKGLLSTEELKDLSAELNLTHIFVVNKNGKFVRSTNEDPKLIPNAYSFCDKYRNMIVGGVSKEATPIIHPQPEPKPYKFLFVPNKKRERLIEVGVRIDFIAKTLTDALGSDTSVLSMALFDPYGTSFGRFNAKEYQWVERKLEMPAKFPAVVDAGESFKFYTKVTSSHPQCCQCDVSQTSKNGEYYYVLESVISKKELATVLATTKTTFFLFGFGNFLLALIFGHFLSRRLVKNIEKAVERVREIKVNGYGRIELNGKDEVSYLTKEFDHLMDSVEESQKKIIEAEKIQVKVQLAKEVAHNIKSPIVAIEMMLPSLVSVPERLRKTLRHSVNEIRELANRLKNQAETMTLDSCEMRVSSNIVYLPILLEDIVSQKQLEYSSKANIKICLSGLGEPKDAFIFFDSTELKSILSNLINNAVESYGLSIGEVNILWTTRDRFCEIHVADGGVGIPREYLESLGTKRITFKGENSRGLGLFHASKALTSWNSEMTINSTLGHGTTVVLKFPQATAAQNQVSANQDIGAI